MRKIFDFVVVVCISLFVTFSTLVIPKTVYNKEEMKTVRFGFPIAFVQQDLSQYDPPFPWKYIVQSPLENPTHFLPVSFLGSLFCFLVWGSWLLFLYQNGILRLKILNNRLYDR